MEGLNECSVPGCGRAQYGRLPICKSHHLRQWKHGDVKPDIPIRPLIRRPRGTKHLTVDGYVQISGEDKDEHVLIAEAVLGRPLKDGEVVHHIDEDRANNAKTNLLICDRGYHMLIHTRMRAIAASGNPDFRKCAICKQWDAPEKMYRKQRGYRHRQCHAFYETNRKKRNDNRLGNP